MPFGASKGPKGSRHQKRGRELERERDATAQRQLDMKSTQTQTYLSVLIFSAAAHPALIVYRTHEHTMPNPSTEVICSRQNQQNRPQGANP
jgi:hypothetical protein